MDERLSKAENLFQRGKFEDSLAILIEALEFDKNDAYIWYLMGQCHRWLDDYDEAVRCLSKSVHLDDQEPSFLQAYGVAFQKAGDLDRAIKQFRRALELNPRYINSINSLALTQRMKGEYENSIKNYQIAIDNLVRNYADDMNNDESQVIWWFGALENDICRENIFSAALYLAARDDMDNCAWPDGESAEKEFNTKAHKGLYWRDETTNDGQSARVFLPNFFDSLFVLIACNDLYRTILENIAVALESSGDELESEKYFGAARFVTSMKEQFSFEGEIYNDARQFVLHLCRGTVEEYPAGTPNTLEVRTTIYHEDPPRNSKWCVATFRNIPSYKGYRVDAFDTKEEAMECIKNIDPTTPLIGGRAFDPVLSYEKYVDWKQAHNFKEFDWQSVFDPADESPRETIVTLREVGL